MQDFPELGVVKMTQEIGFVEPLKKDDSIDFEKVPIGKPLFLYQYHSCDTAAKFPVRTDLVKSGKVLNQVYCWLRQACQLN